jgi:predicted DNA-binding ribbon-helix-helix protein
MEKKIKRINIQLELSDIKHLPRRLAHLYEANPMSPWSFNEARREYQLYYRSGRCWACGSLVGIEYLECGHLIDKLCGGSDDITNLRPMCLSCNRLEKPFHNTIDEVLEWRKEIWSKTRLYEDAQRVIESSGGLALYIRKYCPNLFAQESSTKSPAPCQAWGLGVESK